MQYVAQSRFKYGVLFVGLILGLSAYAQNSAVQAQTGVSTYKNKKSDKENSKTEIGVNLKAISYAEASTVDSQFQQQIEGTINTKKNGIFFGEGSLTLGTFSEPHSVYYAFPQAYLGYGYKNNHVAFGRKKEDLSMADSFLNLGLIQSHFTNDNIEFIEGGLIGLSGEISSNGFGMIANFMPIFIHNQGPQITVEDGKIITSNRWAPQAPSKFKFGSDYKNINYAIREYKTIDIVSNSGYMLHAYAGKNSGRPLLSATYAKKPINDIALSRDTYSDISNFEGYVFFTPVVLNHEVQAVDLNLDHENLKTTISYLADQPINKTAVDQETIQTLSPLSVISVYASLDLSYNFGKKFEAYIGAASITGGEIKELNSSGQESQITVASSRTLFVKPIRMGLKNEMFYIYNKAVETDINLTYDQELKGSLLTAKIKYSPTRNMKIHMGADLLGVENELPDDVQGNFLDQNKANDRFYAGLSYAF